MIATFASKALAWSASVFILHLPEKTITVLEIAPEEFW
jgi:hypothetical protein